MSKYNDLYNSIKNEITSGQIEYGGKLPSVRKASVLYSLSRTTVQNAYFALAADGYIISEPQSGYYVSYKSPKGSKEKRESTGTDRPSMISTARRQTAKALILMFGADT